MKAKVKELYSSIKPLEKPAAENIEEAVDLLQELYDDY